MFEGILNIPLLKNKAGVRCPKKTFRITLVVENKHIKSTNEGKLLFRIQRNASWDCFGDNKRLGSLNVVS